MGIGDFEIREDLNEVSWEFQNCLNRIILAGNNCKYYATITAWTNKYNIIFQTVEEPTNNPKIRIFMKECSSNAVVKAFKWSPYYCKWENTFDCLLAIGEGAREALGKC